MQTALIHLRHLRVKKM